MRKRIIIAFIIIYIAVFFISFSIGRFPIGPVELVKILLSRILPINADWTPQAESVVFNIRLPRILASSLIGAALSLSGLIFQTIFRNPMVSPDVLGASAGAGFGASLAILLGLSSLGISAVSFIAGLAAVSIVWLIGKTVKGNQVLGLVLGGIMVSSIFQSATSFVKLVADTDNQLPAITYFLMGSLAGAGTEELKIIILPIVLSSAVMILLSWRIDILGRSNVSRDKYIRDKGNRYCRGIAYDCIICGCIRSHRMGRPCDTSYNKDDCRDRSQSHIPIIHVIGCCIPYCSRYHQQDNLDI